MTGEPLPWHGDAWQRVCGAIAGDRLGHALLIGAPTGTGRRRFADLLAATLLCRAAEPERRPCNDCPACHQLAAGTHPDCFILEPAEAGKAVGVDAVRDLTDSLHLTAGHGRKIGMIDPADALTVSAANSLLKTLEEPPGGTVVMLLSARSARLPATVRSRCQRITLRVPDAVVARDWLSRQGIAEAGTWLARAGGAPLRALELARTADHHDPGPDPVDILLKVLARRRSAVGGAAELASSPLDTVVRAWIVAIEDLLRLRYSATAAARLPGHEEELAGLAARVDARGAFDYLDALYRSVPGPSSSLRAPMQIQGLLVDAVGIVREPLARGA